MMVRGDARSDSLRTKSSPVGLLNSLLLAVVAGAVMGVVMLAGITWTPNGALSAFGFEGDGG